MKSLWNCDLARGWEHTQFPVRSWQNNCSFLPCHIGHMYIIILSWQAGEEWGGEEEGEGAQLSRSRAWHDPVRPVRQLPAKGAFIVNEWVIVVCVAWAILLGTYQLFGSVCSVFGLSLRNCQPFLHHLLHFHFDLFSFFAIPCTVCFPFPLLRIVVTGNATKSRLNAYKSVDRRRMERRREEKTTEERHKYKNLSVALRQATDEHCNFFFNRLPA